ncbi:hypothetical protein PBI_SCTP2_219 [Salicola phage SCTP-2]|nr:hypothetical protein PBI_SCTP2_219 [Salicola phage SCTP-2]
MKINNLLNENKKITREEIDYAVDLIMNSEFYKNNKNTILKNTNFNLYHNTTVDHGNISHFDIKNREKPRDSNKAIHDIANELSKQQFGIEIRNKLFTTLSEFQGVVYGKFKYIVYPIGSYQLYYSNTIDDFYGDDFKISQYKNIASKIHKYVYQSIINNNYEEIQSISEILKFNFSNYMENVKDQYFNKYLFNHKSSTYHSILNGDEQSYYDLAHFVSIKFNELLFTDFINLDDYVSNDDGSGDDSVFGILESLVQKIMIQNKEDIIELINKHFKDAIQTNYIDTIEKTKYVTELDYHSECIIDSESVLFLSKTAKNQIVSEILRKKSK